MATPTISLALQQAFKKQGRKDDQLTVCGPALVAECDVSTVEEFIGDFGAALHGRPRPATPLPPPARPNKVGGKQDSRMRSEGCKPNLRRASDYISNFCCVAKGTLHAARHGRARSSTPGHGQACAD